jgi:hypothetical protein
MNIEDPTQSGYSLAQRIGIYAFVVVGLVAALAWLWFGIQ